MPAIRAPSRARYSLVLVLGVDCGRVNFDDHSDAGAAGGDALDADPSSLDDYCLRIPAPGAPPSIDGVLEPGLATRLLAPVGIRVAVDSSTIRVVRVENRGGK
jgi:hypothetical protein